MREEGQGLDSFLAVAAVLLEEPASERRQEVLQILERAAGQYNLSLAYRLLLPLALDALEDERIPRDLAQEAATEIALEIIEGVKRNYQNSDVANVMVIARAQVKGKDPKARLTALRALADFTRDTYSGSPSKMAPAVALALCDARPSIRRRAVRGLYITHVEDELPLLLPLLEDDEPDLVEATARRVWILAREGNDLSNHPDTLRGALPEAPSNVQYFLSLALLFHARRTGGELPEILPPDPDDLPDISPETYRGYCEFYQCSRERRSPKGGGSHRKTRDPCGLCGSKDTRILHWEGFADNSGRWEDWEVRCRDCGNYTWYRLRA